MARSEAQGGGIAQSSVIQTGFVLCASGYTLDGTCSTANNLINYVEIAQAGVVTCVPKGSVGLGTTHRYTVNNTSPSATTWRAYIDGVVDSSSLSMGVADYILESTEHTTPGESGSYSVNVTWGSPNAWDRWNRISWVTVQSAFVLVTTGSGWTVTGSPPGAWSVSHP